MSGYQSPAPPPSCCSATHSVISNRLECLRQLKITESGDIRSKHRSVRRHVLLALMQMCLPYQVYCVYRAKHQAQPQALHPTNRKGFPYGHSIIDARHVLRALPCTSWAPTALANPMPRERTKGTVTGPVVTPALSHLQSRDQQYRTRVYIQYFSCASMNYTRASTHTHTHEVYISKAHTKTHSE